MKGYKKEIIYRARAEFGRGELMQNENNKTFFTLRISASPEDYDYANWEEQDLVDLKEAIEFILANKEVETHE